MKIHILAKPRGGQLSCALHFATPAGDNTANVPWKTVLTRLGRLGTYGSHLDETDDAAEIAQIVAGDVIELVATLHDNEGAPTLAVRKATLETEADREIAEFFADNSAKYEFYGYAFGTVS